MPGTIVFKIIDFEFVFGKLLNFEKFFARFDLLGAKQTIHLVRMVGFLFKVPSHKFETVQWKCLLALNVPGDFQSGGSL